MDGLPEVNERWSLSRNHSRVSVGYLAMPDAVHWEANKVPGSLDCLQGAYRQVAVREKSTTAPLRLLVVELDTTSLQIPDRILTSRGARENSV